MTHSNRQQSRVAGRVSDGFIVSRRNYSQQPDLRSTGRAETVAKAASREVGPTRTSTGSARVVSKSQLPAVEQLPHFDLPRYRAPEHPLSIVRRRRPWLRGVMKGLAVMVGLVILSGGLLVWRGYSNVHKVFRGSSTVAALSSTHVAPELLKGEGDGRVNILMLGVGGENHPGGDLTDTIMVLSVDPVNKKAAMLSVPRDLWVKMPVNYFGSYQKLNAAYSSGKYKYLGKTDLSSDNQQAIEAGFSSIDTAVGDVLGIAINYNVLVDFQAFQQAVDTVDGVTVNVTEQLYDPTMAWENAHSPILAAIGVQKMNGKQALLYARSRETSSDFARSERQRQLTLALKQKALSLGTLSSPAKIDSLMNAFGDNVRTDLSTTAASRLYSIMRQIDDSDISSLSLTSPQNLVTTDRVGSASVVRPKAGFDTYSEIQSYVRSQLRDGYLVKEAAGVYVVGATEDLKQHTADVLTSYGYNVVGTATGKNLPAGMTIVDLTDGAKPYTKHYLQDRYGVSTTATLPQPGITVPTNAQFVIIAGI